MVIVAAGVDAARQALAGGARVVVVDRADRLVALLAEQAPNGPWRLAVLVGDPTDPATLEAARTMAGELFPPAS